MTRPTAIISMICVLFRSILCVTVKQLVRVIMALLNVGVSTAIQEKTVKYLQVCLSIIPDNVNKHINPCSPHKHLNFSHLSLETKWECKECRDEERSHKSTFGETWGHLKSLDCDQCMEECDKDDICDGIQCVNIVKTPVPPTNSSVSKDKVLSLEEYQSSKDPISVGIPCQWLKKPKNSEKCKSDGRYMTCWKKYPYWRK